MTKLVKNSVTLDSPIADLVIRDIRHISGGTSLNECARVLARTKYALVDKKHLITTDTYLQFLAAKLGAKKAAELVQEPAKVQAEAVEVKEVAQEVNEAQKQETEDPVKASYLKYATVGVLTAGLATGAFFLAKNKK